MKQVVVFPRGQLTAKDKERLSKGGVLAIEADDPSKVVCLVAGLPLVSSNEMLASALAAMADEDHFPTNRKFVEQLAKRALAAEKSQFAAGDRNG